MSLSEALPLMPALPVICPAVPGCNGIVDGFVSVVSRDVLTDAKNGAKVFNLTAPARKYVAQSIIVGRSKLDKDRDCFSLYFKADAGSAAFNAALTLDCHEIKQVELSDVWTDDEKKAGKVHYKPAKHSNVLRLVDNKTRFTLMQYVTFFRMLEQKDSSPREETLYGVIKLCTKPSGGGGGGGGAAEYDSLMFMSGDLVKLRMQLAIGLRRSVLSDMNAEEKRKTKTQIDVLSTGLVSRFSVLHTHEQQEFSNFQKSVEKVGDLPMIALCHEKTFMPFGPRAGMWLMSAAFGLCGKDMMRTADPAFPVGAVNDDAKMLDDDDAAERGVPQHPTGLLYHRTVDGLYVLTIPADIEPDSLLTDNDMGASLTLWRCVRNKPIAGQAAGPPSASASVSDKTFVRLAYVYDVHTIDAIRRRAIMTGTAWSSKIEVIRDTYTRLCDGDPHRLAGHLDAVFNAKTKLSNWQCQHLIKTLIAACVVVDDNQQNVSKSQYLMRYIETRPYVTGADGAQLRGICESAKAERQNIYEKAAAAAAPPAVNGAVSATVPMAVDASAADAAALKRKAESAQVAGADAEPSAAKRPRVDNGGAVSGDAPVAAIVLQKVPDLSTLPPVPSELELLRKQLAAHEEKLKSIDETHDKVLRGLVLKVKSMFETQTNLLERTRILEEKYQAAAFEHNFKAMASRIDALTKTVDTLIDNSDVTMKVLSLPLLKLAFPNSETAQRATAGTAAAAAAPVVNGSGGGGGDVVMSDAAPAK